MPIGALEAANQLVPFKPTRALICPENPHVPQRVVTSRTDLTELSRDLNAARVLPLNEQGVPTSCPDDRSVFYDIYVSDATAVVQIRVGDRGCLSMSNGIRTTGVPADLVQRLHYLVST